MISKEKLFRNYFNDEKIISLRLYNFSADTIGKLSTANTGNIYDALIQNITTVHQAFGIEIGEVKSAEAMQKGTTLTNDEVMNNFKTYMSDNLGVIAKAVGGKKSAAFLAFFPIGLSEYSKPTKTKMPALLKQVFDAAATYSAQLGTTMTAELKAFTTQWNSTRNTQLLQKGTVAENRVEKSINREALEIELLKALSWVSYLHPGDVEICSALFDFSLLDAPARKSRKSR